MTFADRMKTAAPFESQVLDYVRGRGWSAYPFGQALLEPDARKGLQRMKTLVRWLPDIIVTSWPYSDIGGPIFIDAKHSYPHERTGNHSVEQASTTAQIWFSTLSAGTALYAYPHHDGRIGFERADSWEQRATHMDGLGTHGSGTPFAVAPCDCKFLDG